MTDQNLEQKLMLVAEEEAATHRRKFDSILNNALDAARKGDYSPLSRASTAFNEAYSKVGLPQVVANAPAAPTGKAPAQVSNYMTLPIDERIDILKTYVREQPAGTSITSSGFSAYLGLELTDASDLRSFRAMFGKGLIEVKDEGLIVEKRRAWYRAGTPVPRQATVFSGDVHRHAAVFEYVAKLAPGSQFNAQTFKATTGIAEDSKNAGLIGKNFGNTMKILHKLPIVAEYDSSKRMYTRGPDDKVTELIKNPASIDGYISAYASQNPAGTTFGVQDVLNSAQIEATNPFVPIVLIGKIDERIKAGIASESLPLTQYKPHLYRITEVKKKDT